ncbi:MAG TPA: hypothetical protein VIJ85_03555, partial [Rhizomicrobium sp.]
MQRVFLRIGQFGADIGDHHVPSRHHAVHRMHAIDVPAARIGDFNALRRFRIADVLHADDGGRQANGDRRARFVERGIVRARGDDIFDAVSRHRIGNELAHQQPRDTRVAVGEMECRLVMKIL